MKYLFIKQQKHEFPIVVMGHVLGVSESGFYAWRKRPICQRHREDAQSRQEIRQVFSIHQGRYGSPPIQKEQHDQGREISRKRRRVLTTRRDLSHPVAPNILNRDFRATEPNTTWATDITYIPTMQGWLYLAVILDLYSRSVVGWSMSGRCDEEQAERALDMALARRRPAPGLVHHSNRGCQYTSRAYRHRLEQAGMVVSMSCKGHYWNNATMESFFGSLKEECIATTIYSSHEQARQALFESSKSIIIDKDAIRLRRRLYSSSSRSISRLMDSVVPFRHKTPNKPFGSCELCTEKVRGASSQLSHVLDRL
jgi:putative transposase